MKTRPPEQIAWVTLAPVGAETCRRGHIRTPENTRYEYEKGRKYLHLRCMVCIRKRTRGKYQRRMSLPNTTKNAVVFAGQALPAQRVAGGYGYYRALVCDPKQTHTQCHICGRFWKNLGIHLKRAHNMAVKSYKAKYIILDKWSLIAPASLTIHKNVFKRMSPADQATKLQKLAAATQQRIERSITSQKV